MYAIVGYFDEITESKLVTLWEEMRERAIKIILIGVRRTAPILPSPHSMNLNQICCWRFSD
ncbi:hypothetical protein CHH51_01145 [Terribacillus saccharophilus]|nr:hypothetical protein CHH51_01145 [Terribacillus saccharophilus]